MTFVHKKSNINRVVKDPERSGRGALSLILPNPINKAKDNQLLSMSLKEHSIMSEVFSMILNKFVVSDLACATRKISHQKQNP